MHDIVGLQTSVAVPSTEYQCFHAFPSADPFLAAAETAPSSKAFRSMWVCLAGCLYVCVCEDGLQRSGDALNAAGETNPWVMIAGAARERLKIAM